MSRNGSITPQGQPRPSSQTSSIGSQQNTPRPRVAARHSSMDVNSSSEAALLDPRVEAQQLHTTPSGSAATMAFPSSFLPATNTSIGDQPMEYVLDTPANIDPTNNQVTETEETRNGTNEPQQTDQVTQTEPWWEAYSKVRSSQAKTRKQVKELNEKLKQSLRDASSLEDRVQLLEAQLGGRQNRRG
ncbi:uncharacterized protein FMAN_07328 [Fusarium mangiferae]|uniref:Uncharacterized protein n=1 Tax=Fusarium mangiferae TaxID=192010 RepID=A0A1L7T6T5_FUSMA|nr:uncharacterized protein FMAN_07328 [Fusarium mangiferae]CVK92432.1 uncharacterized protein FMAN_07328 [Fusarium mangiferae]